MAGLPSHAAGGALRLWHHAGHSGAAADAASLGRQIDNVDRILGA
jgi:hypothetical protein